MSRRWRILLKKQQRKRRRQKAAQERDKKLEEDELEKLKDPSYKQQLEYQEQCEQIKLMAEEKLRQENEELWLRRELLSQKQFQREEQKRKAEEKIQEELRMQKHKELVEREEYLQRKRDEAKKKAEETEKEFEETMKLMRDYMENDGMKTPEKLKRIVETLPGKNVCEIHCRTHCCRYGAQCHYNHPRPMLSHVIVIRNFFQHRRLDQQLHKEYDSAEEGIEVSESDLRKDYAEFCADVWPELERFGTIVNFRTVRNKHPLSKGSVFVEYTNKRSAIKAFINLQNRFYATKRLNVEFSHISRWRTAICGMIFYDFFDFKGFSFARKCPKGADCNYLHILPNPEKKYNAPLEPYDRYQRKSTNLETTLHETPSSSWNTNNTDRSRNWRWSESPVKELAPQSENTESQENNKSQKSVKQEEPIVISSSSKDGQEYEDKAKKKINQGKKQLQRRRSNIKLNCRPNKASSQKPKNMCHKDGIDLPSSSSDDFEFNGEIRRKCTDSVPVRSRREDRDRHRRSYKHKRAKSTSSEESHRRSQRKDKHEKATDSSSDDYEFNGEIRRKCTNSVPERYRREDRDKHRRNYKHERVKSTSSEESHRRSQRKHNYEKATDSSTDDFLFNGEIRRKCTDSVPERHRREDRDKHRRNYKHEHAESTSSEESYRRSQRKHKYEKATDSSSDDSEFNGEKRRKCTDSAPESHRREDRDKHRRNYKHEHAESTSSEESYRRSQRKHKYEKATDSSSDDREDGDKHRRNYKNDRAESTSSEESYRKSRRKHDSSSHSRHHRYSHKSR